MVGLSLSMALLLTTSVAPTEEATAAFRRGRELLQRGRLADACAAFEESHRLDPALGALLNLAECTLKLDHRARAWMLYGEVLAWATRTQNEQRLAVARERLAALRPSVALLVVDAPVGTAVRVDRLPLVLGQTLALEPGAHVVELDVEGRETETRSLVVQGGETLTLRPTPTEPPVTVSAPPALVPTTDVTRPIAEPVAVLASPPSRVGPVSLLVGGALVAIAAAVGLAWSVDVWSRAEAQRAGPLSVTRETYQTASVLYPLSWAGLGLGTASALAAVLWWWRA